MRRQLMVLAIAGVIGVFVTAGDAQACHKKKCPCPAPAPVVCAPVPAPAPVVCEPAPKKCGLMRHNAGCGHKKMSLGGLCHKKKACEPVAVCEAAPVGYAAPVYAAPQAPVYAAPQASRQGQ